MSDQWLSIVEYARQFNMSDMTVRRRIKTGKIQAVLREGKYFIPMSEALRRMSQQQTPAAPSHANHLRQEVSRPLVKAHPMPERPSMPPQPKSMAQIPVQYMEPSVQNSHAHSQSPIPHSLKQHAMAHTNANVDTATFIAFCESALSKANEAERRLESQYKEIIGRLESELSSKDLQLKSLSQQVEDLQLLIKILERKVQSRA